jgi:hypothetical protein
LDADDFWILKWKFNYGNQEKKEDLVFGFLYFSNSNVLTEVEDEYFS